MKNYDLLDAVGKFDATKGKAFLKKAVNNDAWVRTKNIIVDYFWSILNLNRKLMPLLMIVLKLLLSK